MTDKGFQIKTPDEAFAVYEALANNEAAWRNAYNMILELRNLDEDEKESRDEAQYKCALSHELLTRYVRSLCQLVEEDRDE